jgi:hypothetical protein
VVSNNVANYGQVISHGGNLWTKFHALFRLNGIMDKRGIDLLVREATTLEHGIAAVDVYVTT